MGKSSIVIDESLIRKARKLTGLRTKRQIVDRALNLLVRSESRKGILKYFGSGIWQGGAKRMRATRQWSTYLEEGPIASQSFMKGIK